MHLTLVHHAEALAPHVDPQRALTARGRDQAAGLAARAHEHGIVPAAIWPSGKLRSRQTADAYLRVCNPFAEFKMIRGLRPDDPVEWIVDLVAAEERDVLLVGHMPHLPELLRTLDPEAAAMPLHGLVNLERTGPRRFVEALRLTADV
jgi:phosphohistidine phosphatase